MKRSARAVPVVRNLWSCRRALAPSLMVAVLAACSSGPAPSLPIPWTSPDQFDAESREYYDVVHTRTGTAEDGGTATAPESVIGHVYMQENADDTLTWVLDRTHDEIGFVLKNNLTFRLVDGADASGAEALAHEELGDLGFEGGIARLFGVPESEIRLVSMVRVQQKRARSVTSRS